MHFIKFLSLISLVFVLSSCASSPMIQPQINSLVIGGQFDYALKLLKDDEKSYGAKNRLLYLMDYAMVLHQARRYEDSIQVFEEAKRTFDYLYTTSLTKELSTWVVNDNTAPYHGEDFERVMINIFQAMNYASLGNFNEALVEARQVDNTLSLINRRYKPDQMNVYKEDAFARFLMGALYEAAGSSQDINDAYISYSQAAESYQNEFGANFGVTMPQILKENLLAAAKWMGQNEFQQWKQKLPGVSFYDLDEKNKMAEVYLIHYQGLSPIKLGTFIPIPLPDGYLTKLAFPYYERRTENFVAGTFKAAGIETKLAQTELGEDIGAIAIKNLENRKFRVVAKAILRSGVKYSVERILENQIRGQSSTAADAFTYLSSLYNLISEQPDLRSWQTLPDKIAVARLLLKPGQYNLSFNDKPLENVDLKGGQKKFLFVRTSR